MYRIAPKLRFSLPFRLIAWAVLVSFNLTSVIGPTQAQAQSLPSSLGLPQLGTMLKPSNAYVPLMLKGIEIQSQKPFNFNFFIDTGDSGLKGQNVSEEAEKLIKYFLASLAMPEADLWVNLSPYEKERIIPDQFGRTEMGRDLLAQDYVLKQLTASLTYPETELGKTFWEKVKKDAFERFGAKEIPLNTFNKVWIVPDDPVVYQKGTQVFVIESRLKVMLEEDYKALRQAMPSGDQKDKTAALTAPIVREIIIPAIEKEVNEGKNFASLRQIQNALILAVWYKKVLKNSLLARLYANQQKVEGIDLNDPAVNQQIYDQYLKGFQSGVYNYIKEEFDQNAQEMIPRKYFSGGYGTKDVSGRDLDSRMKIAYSVADMPARAQKALVADLSRVDSGSSTVVNIEVNFSQSGASSALKEPWVASTPTIPPEVRKILTDEDIEELQNWIENRRKFINPLLGNIKEKAEDPRFYDTTIRANKIFFSYFTQAFSELIQKSDGSTNARLDAFRDAFDEAERHAYFDMLPAGAPGFQPEKTSDRLAGMIRRALKSHDPVLFYSPIAAGSRLDEALEEHIRSRADADQFTVERLIGTPDTNRMQIFGERMPVEKTKRTSPEEKIRFEQGVLYRLIKQATANPKRTYILRFEQLEALNAKVWSQLNQFLLTGEIEIPETGERLTMPDNLKIIASITTGLSDAAFYDRFARKQVPVMTNEEFSKYIGKKFNLSEDTVTRVNDYFAVANTAALGRENYFTREQILKFFQYISGQMRDFSVDGIHVDMEREFDLFKLAAFPESPMRWAYHSYWKFDDAGGRLLIDSVELPVSDTIKQVIAQKLANLGYTPPERETKIIQDVIKEQTGLILTQENSLALSMIAREYRYGNGVIRLLGPTGIGKTYLAEKVAQLMGIPFYGEPFHGASKQEKLLGAVKIDKQGEPYLDQDTPFLDRLENGGVMALSELNAAEKDGIARFGWMLVPLARGDKEFVLNQYPSADETTRTIKRHPQSLIIIDTNPSDTYEARGELPPMLEAYTPAVVMTGEYSEDELKEIAEDYLTDVPELFRKQAASLLAKYHLKLQEKLDDKNRQIAKDEPHTISLRELRNAARYMAAHIKEKISDGSLDEIVKDGFQLGGGATPFRKADEVWNKIFFDAEWLYYGLAFKNEEDQNSFALLLSNLPEIVKGNTIELLTYSLLDTTSPTMLALSSEQNPMDVLDQITAGRTDVEVVKENMNLFTDDFTLFGGNVPDESEETKTAKWAAGILEQMIAKARANPDKTFILALENYHYLRPKMAVALNAILQERVYYSPDSKEEVTIPDNLRFFAGVSRDVPLEISLAEQSRWVRINAEMKGKQIKRSAAVSNIKPGVIKASEWALAQTVLSPDERTFLTLSSGDTRPLTDMEIQMGITPGSPPEYKTWDVVTRNSIGEFPLLPGMQRAVFSPDQRSMISWGFQRKFVQVWDAATRKPTNKIEGFREFVISADYSPDGKYIVVAELMGTVRLFDAKTGAFIRIIRKAGSWSAKGVKFSPDSKSVAFMRDFGFEIINLETNKKVESDKTPAGQDEFGFSPDGRYIITGSEDGNAYLWDAVTGKQLKVFLGHSDWVLSASFSPDGNYILTSSRDGTVILWDVETSKELKKLTDHTGSVLSSGFFPSDQTKIYSGGADGTVRIWDVSDVVGPSSTQPAQEQTHWKLQEHDAQLEAHAVSPDNSLIVTSDNRGTLWVSDAVTKAPLYSLNTNPGEIRFEPLEHIVITPDNRFIAAANSSDVGKDPGKVTLWDTQTRQEVPLTGGTHERAISALKLTPDGKYLISGDETGRVILWDMETKKALGVFELGGMAKQIYVSADGQYFSVSDEGLNSKMWRIETRSVLLGISSKVVAVEVSGLPQANVHVISSALPKGRFILTGHRGGIVKMWDAGAKTFVKEFTIPGADRSDEVRFIDISSDGKYFLAGDGYRKVAVWETEKASNQPINTISMGFDQLMGAKFVGQGNYIVTNTFKDFPAAIGSKIHEKNLFSTKSGKEVKVADDDTKQFDTMTVSPDERFVVVSERESKSAEAWLLEKKKPAPARQPAAKVVGDVAYDIDRAELGPEHPQPLTGDDLLVDIPETVTIENQIFAGMNEHKVIVLEGDPGGGKTDIALDVASRLGLRSHLYSAYGRSHLRDFIGMMTKDENGRFILTGKPDANGRFNVPFLDMYTHGGVFIIDEGAIGRQSQAVISWLTGLARGEQELVIHHPGQEPLVLKRHKHFHVIITTNPEEETPSRERIPPEVMSRAQRILVNNDLPENSLIRIAMRFLQRSLKEFDLDGKFSMGQIEAKASKLVNRHKKAIRFIKENAFVDNPERHIITMRDMRNWIKAYIYLSKTHGDAAIEAAQRIIYAAQFSPEVQRSPELGNNWPRVASVSRERFQKLGKDIGTEEDIRTDLETVFALGQHGLLLLEPGSRDRKIISDFVAEQGYRPYDFEANPQMTELDLIGGLFPFLEGETRPNGKEFGEKAGFLTRHLVRSTEAERNVSGDKKLLVIHNIDALPERIRAVLNNFLLKGYIERRDDNGRMVRYYLPANTKIVATLSYLSQRDFSSAFFNRFVKLHVSPMSAIAEGYSELMQALIFEQGLDELEARLIQRIYLVLKELEDGGQFWPSGKKYNFTIKEALLLGQFVALAKKENPQEDIRKIVVQEALRLYGNRVREFDSDYENFVTVILKTLFEHSLVQELSGRVDYNGEEIAALSGVPLASTGKRWEDVDARYRLTLVPAITKTMSSVLRGWQAGKIVSIVGETGAAKTTMGVFLSQMLFGRDDSESHYYIYSTHGESKVSDLGLQLSMTPEGRFKLQTQEFLRRVEQGNQVIIIDEANMKPEMLWALNGLARGDKEITVEIPGEQPRTVKVGENVFIMMTMNPESYQERGVIPEVLEENTYKLWAPINYDNAELTAILTDLARAAERKVIDRDVLRQAQVSIASSATKITIEDLLTTIKEEGREALRKFSPQELRELEQEILAMPDVKKKMDTIRTKAAVTAKGVTLVFSLREWWSQTMDGKFINVPLFELVNPERSPEAVVGLIIHELRHKLHSTTDKERDGIVQELGQAYKDAAAEPAFHELWNSIEDPRIDTMEDPAKPGEYEYVQAMNREFFGKPMIAEDESKMIEAAMANPHVVLRGALMKHAYGEYYRGRDQDTRFSWTPRWAFFDSLPQNVKDAINKLTEGGENSVLYRATRAPEAVIDFEGIEQGQKDAQAEKMRAAKASFKVIIDEIYPVYKELFALSQQSQSSPGQGQPGQGEAGQGIPGQGSFPEIVVLTAEEFAELTQGMDPQGLPPGTTPQQIAIVLGVDLPPQPGQASPQPKFLTDEERDALINDLDAKIKKAKAARQKEMKANEPLNLSLSEVSGYGKKLADGFIRLFRVPEEPEVEESASGWVVNTIRYLTGNSEPFDQEVSVLGKPNLALGVTIDVTGSMDEYRGAILKMLAIMMSSFEQIGKKKAEYSVSVFNDQFDDSPKPFNEKLNLAALNAKFGEIVNLIKSGGRPGTGTRGTSVYVAVEGIIEKHKKIKKLNKIELVLTDGDDNMGDLSGGKASQRLKAKLAEAKKLGIEIIAIGFDGPNSDNVKIFDKYIRIDRNNPESMVEALLKIARAKVNHGRLPDGDLGENLNFKMLKVTSVEKASSGAVSASIQNETLGGPAPVGGIDLNPANFELRIKRDADGTPLPFSQQPVEIQNFKIDGLVPVILNITPIPTLPVFLNMAESEKQQLSSAR